MPNLLTGGGLTPIIYASEMLARHIGSLENYEIEVKKHPMSAPALARARRLLLELTDNDVANIVNLIVEIRGSKVKLPLWLRLIKYPSLIPKLREVIGARQALRISRDYGW